jgi:hypothetical protein
MKYLILLILLLCPPKYVDAQENKPKTDLEEFKQWSDVFLTLLDQAIKLENQSHEKKEDKTNQSKENLGAPVNQKDSDQIVDQITDPDKGAIRHMFDFIVRMIDKETTKRDEQAKRLDREIELLVSGINEVGIEETKLKLALIRWQPIGVKRIDTEMTAYYEDLVKDLLFQLNSRR